MKKKLLIGTILLLFILLGVSYGLNRNVKEEISCSSLETLYADYPIQFQNIEQNAVMCETVRNYFQNKEKLMFSIDGVTVWITKKREDIHPRVRKNTEKSIKKQVQHHGKSINIRYSAHQQSINTDIYADFMFSMQNYYVRGNIRGLYTQEKDKQLQDIPNEVFAQTEERILAFVDTYIK